MDDGGIAIVYTINGLEYMKDVVICGSDAKGRVRVCASYTTINRRGIAYTTINKQYVYNNARGGWNIDTT